MAAQDQEKPGSGTLPSAEPLQLAGLVNYAQGSIVSRALVQSKPGSVTLFAFDAGQGLNEHTTPYDAHVVSHHVGTPA